MATERNCQALLGGTTDTAICSSNHLIGFTGLPAVTRQPMLGTGVRETPGVSATYRQRTLSLLNIKESTLHLWVSKNKTRAVAFMASFALNPRLSRRG